ncbi:hypothetical protein OS128_05165 [Corynebacterium sp. P5848]|uniref:hypothetical protein n=1 Tax=Corynebacterium marambiense TaxID=2765364 RepID=UPI002260FDE7|nr:hypothetical protein [Corynebacterium marambiense]MCX7542300.1 hypothetical protein [Corynebacterium marambiense]
MDIDWNLPAFEEIRRSSETQSAIDGLAADIVDQAGDGYGSDSQQGESRYRAIVYADTSAAIRDNARNNTIVKAADTVAATRRGG